MQVRSIKLDSSFKKTYYLTNIRASGNIFFLDYTQRHVGLHPARPVAHTGFQTEEETQGVIHLSGVSYPIRINITADVILLICIILEPILNCTLQVPH